MHQWPRYSEPSAAGGGHHDPSAKTPASDSHGTPGDALYPTERHATTPWAQLPPASVLVCAPSPVEAPVVYAVPVPPPPQFLFP